MPVVRASTSGNDSEGLTGGASSELTRVTSNLTLSDHIGRYVAGEVAKQFQNENLADLLKGRNAIMISGSWG